MFVIVIIVLTCERVLLRERGASELGRGVYG